MTYRVLDRVCRDGDGVALANAVSAVHGLGFLLRATSTSNYMYLGSPYNHYYLK